jgi:hypothetical protein
VARLVVTGLRVSEYGRSEASDVLNARSVDDLLSFFEN